MCEKDCAREAPEALTWAVPLTATDLDPLGGISDARRWAILAVGTASSVASAVIVFGPAFLIPVLHERHGMSLAEAGLVASASMAGLMLTLVLWGLVVDRRGERFGLLAGLGLATVASAAATLTDGVWSMAAALGVAGAASASTNSASGRVVVGWFRPERRGLAMGIRQTGQPLGVGIAAGTIAYVADRWGLTAALWVPVAASAIALLAVALVVIDPPRPPHPGRAEVRNPYRADSFLARVHGASVLLVVPQFLVWTFGLTWLITDLGWEPGPAGLVVLLTQLLGAAARIGAGWVTDVVGSRMRPMRAVALLAVVTMLLLGAAAALDGAAWSAVAVLLLVVASAVTVADNGLAFTAVAETAGPFWAGRAIGIHNTAQHVVATAVPPLAGLAITLWGFPATFALVAVFPLVAVSVVPVAAERARSTVS